MSTSFEALPQLLVNGILMGSFYSLLAVSIGLIYATTRTFHFAHALTFTLAAYAALVVSAAGWSILLGFVVAVLVAAAFGYGIDRLIYARLRRRGGSALSIFLASLGVLVAGEAILQAVFGPDSRPLGRGIWDRAILMGSVGFNMLDIINAVVSWVLILGVGVLLTRTRLGTAMRAVSSNEGLAQTLGIGIVGIYGIVFILGSALAGVAGVLYAMQNTASPGFGLTLVLTAFIGMFIGGVGNFTGAALGGLILGVFENVGAIFLPGYVHTIVSFALLFAVLLWRPTGLFGLNAGLTRG